MITFKQTIFELRKYYFHQKKNPMGINIDAWGLGTSTSDRQTYPINLFFLTNIYNYNKNNKPTD